jgi:hypothetical protein
MIRSVSNMAMHMLKMTTVTNIVMQITRVKMGMSIVNSEIQP